MVQCLDCHAADKNHIDHTHRTYDAGVTDYTDSYRLKNIGSLPAMNIPRPLYSPGSNPLNNPGDFALCFDCHNKLEVLNDSVLSPIESNFWNNDSSPTNSHNIHLSLYTNHFDSDWDGTADSSESCIACHNVHGSPTKVMTRHGELISTPGTTDKVPALNFAYLVPSTGPDATATWTPTITQAGSYKVYAWWSVWPNRATDAPYRITDSSSTVHTVRVDQQVNGGQWNLLGTFTLASGSGMVELGNDADGFVIADAVKWEWAGGGSGPADIIIDNPAATYVGFWPATSADPGFYGTDFQYHAKQIPPSSPTATLDMSVGGRMDFAGPYISQNGVCNACHGAISYVRAPNLSPRVIQAKATPDTVTNDGSESTLITAFVHDPDGDFDNTLPSKIEVDLSSIGSSGSQAMFDDGTNGDEVSGDGVYSYLASVPGSTSDSPKDLVITATDDASNTGEGIAQLLVIEPGSIYLDNPDAVFACTWTVTSGDPGFYGKDFQYHAAGTGSCTATWTPAIPATGNYAVYAWWSAYSNRATDAPYTVTYNGGSQTFDMNQKVNGGQWNLLGTFNFLAGTSGTVVLTDNADGFVIADGLKFKPVP
jgi:hypothetical protein